MFFYKVRNKIFKFGLNNHKENQAQIFLWLFILLYISILVLSAVKRYYFFSYNVSDLAIFNQTFFNTLHGRWFQETIIGENLFASHFSPIILFLLPFYFLLPFPLTLLVLQTVFLALAAWPLFCLTKELTKNEKIALLVGVAWLLNPMVHWANLDENHLLYLIPFLVFWTAYFYWQGKFIKFIIFFILALLVREDVPMLMLAWSVIAFIDRRGKKWIISPLLLAGIYFLLSLAIIKFFAGDNNYKYFIFYGWLGGSDLFSIIWSWFAHPYEVFKHLFSFTNISSIFFIFLVLLYIPLIKPKYLLLSLLPFFQLAMNVSGFSHMAYSTRFSLLFLPGIFLAFIFSLQHIQQRKKFLFSSLVYKNFIFSKFILIFTLIYFVVFLSPTIHIISKNKDVLVRDWKTMVLTAVPKEASIAASNNFLPSLSNREFLYAIDYVYYGRKQFGQEEFNLPEIEYLLVDYSDFLGSISDAQNNPFYKKYWPQMSLKWREFLQGYSLIRAENNVLLWQKKTDSQVINLKFYELKDKKAKGNSGNFLFNYNSILNQSHRVLKLSIQDIGDPNKNYLIRFYYKNSFIDMPLDYGLMTASDWSEKEASFYYYLDPSVEYYQIFSWQGINKMGVEQDVYLDKKIKAMTEKNGFVN